MLITSYYRGGTDKLSGVTFNTDNKTFVLWTLPSEEWTQTIRQKNKEYSKIKDNFHLPGDISFYHVHLYELKNTILQLKAIGFTEDHTTQLSFF